MLTTLFQSKTIKPKEKVAQLAQWLREGALSSAELLEFAKRAKEPERASCIEALEFVTKENPAFADEYVWHFAIQSLPEKAPRIKWESAKVLGNIAPRFIGQLEEAIPGLLLNATHPGTVVRWSAAFALAEMLKCGGNGHTDLREELTKLRDQEEQASIRKVYDKVLKIK